MKTSTATISRFELHDFDKVGVTASVVCAIHCGIAPFLLIAMPAFGKIWAHPASHALVALLIVPIAVLSIRKGFAVHKKRWVMVAAITGIACVIGGALLPLFTNSAGDAKRQLVIAAQPNSNSVSEQLMEEEVCTACEGEDLNNDFLDSDGIQDSACIDACCPSLQVTESGEMSLHIPPAAIVTTLGGFFLIAAHAGNLCLCKHACRTKECCVSKEC